ncbi:hypothetical protein Bbelb_222550 [Branchiostoma belcheri]|nr:hypothetical protein Bbelb_222550 [Branchiostoma belcheri]
MTGHKTQARSTYGKECGKVKHTALPAPCCSALHNCVSPKGYGNGDGHHPTLCTRARETFFFFYFLDTKCRNTIAPRTDEERAEQKPLAELSRALGFREEVFGSSGVHDKPAEVAAKSSSPPE